MAVFSDTTLAQTGLIQHCERWTGLGNGAISGDSVLLPQFTQAINDAFDQVLPSVLSRSGKGRWDDLNNTDHPIATLNMVSGQPDYSVKVDGDNLDILRIFDVRIIKSASGTNYETLIKIGLEDERALATMSPNPSDSGIPDHWLERGNTIFLGPNPNFGLTNGIKIFFERVENYFLSTDTTKVPGIPRLYHTILADIASYEWLVVNKPLDVTVYQALQQKIATRMKQLSDSEDGRNPLHSRFTIATNNQGVNSAQSGRIGTGPMDSNR